MFNILQMTLAVSLPYSLSLTMETYTSVRRLEAVLRLGTRLVRIVLGVTVVNDALDASLLF